MDLSSLFNLLLLIFGFGFVIFWHELGHFLAAKWAGVKVEQFAVGFGQALLCWRKGLGTSVGTSAPRMQKAIDDARSRGEVGSDDDVRQRLGIGETEYRLNWIPLGGYVKMLGQDDMNPNATSLDAKSYNNKPISKRMVIVSAGVIMNVILAAILFVALFLHGFRTPAPVVGYAQAGSPADRAGLATGDRILRFNGATMHDFNKIRLATALAHPTESAVLDVQKPDGKQTTVNIVPLAEATDGGFLQIGVGPAPLLEAADGVDKLPGDDLIPATSRLLGKGEKIIAVNGTPLVEGPLEASQDAALAQFDRALQESGGKPLELTLRSAEGATRQVSLQPNFEPSFGSSRPNFAGMQPRVAIAYLQEQSAARGKLRPGDVVVRVSADTATHDAVENPTHQQFLKTVETASNAGVAISIDIERAGQRMSFDAVPLNVKIESMIGIDRKGLGIGLDSETQQAVIAGVMEDSGAMRAGLKSGMRITAVNDAPVSSWFEVHNALKSADESVPIRLAVASASGGETLTLTPSSSETDILTRMRYAHGLALKERSESRQTNNPVTALAWGAGETRDLIVQFYVTLKRMLIQQSISAKNLSGPVGILHSGTLIASRGTDWLIWYLAVISANLAVVNFLPIPIVDGGLFVFLLIEKLRGRPVSPRIMAATQFVGLALLLSLFLFVTYNDILRLF